MPPLPSSLRSRASTCLGPRFPGALLLVAAASLPLVSSGCDSCNGEPKVPFKLGSESDADLELALERELDAESKVFASAVDRPSLDGKQLPVDFVRAVLAHDLDGDGDRDALMLAHDTEQRMRLLVSSREGDVFLAPIDVAGFSAPGDASCTLREVGLDALARDKAVLTISLSCGDPQTPRAPSLTLLSLEAPPRVYERFEVLAPQASAPISLSASATDADADGHADYVLQIAGPAPSGAAEPLKLAWLDRASGLSRDMREPEATFSAWASAAQSLLSKSPAQALETASRVLDLERTLCRERGEPRFLVSGAPGISCGQSKAATSALATATLAHAKLKHAAEALAVFGELSRRESKLDKRSSERVLSAIASLPSQKGITLREGPRVEPSGRPNVQLPSARFVDDTTLYLRRAAPASYDLATRVETGLAAAADDLMRDPGGQLLVSDIERDSCGFYRLRIERAPRSGAPYMPAAAVATPALLPSNGLAACKQAGAQPRAESGFRLLGWAPQGVVAARGNQVMVVPLSIAGAAAAEPFALSADAPLPAPLPAGLASPDGARYAELTPAGVLVFERKATAPELWRPDGYVAIAPSVREVAISPSGRHVAVVANAVVYILSRDAPR